MRRDRGARDKARSRNSGKGNRKESNRSFRFRPNPLRQLLFVCLALAGIGIGYGTGFLLKENSTPPEAEKQVSNQTSARIPARPLPTEQKSQPAPPAISEPARPLLPENAEMSLDKPPRAYEEALPKGIIENTQASRMNEGAKEHPEESQTTVPDQEKKPITEEPDAPPAGDIQKPETPETSASMPEKLSKATSQPEPQKEKREEPPSKPKTENQPEIAALAPAPAKVPKIAVIIDDLGIDKSRTARAIRLPGPLTLSFLTYADDLDKQTRAAKKAGHELLLHIPMEPGSPDVDPGPNVLLTGVPPKELLSSLKWNLDQFSGYVGVNNHMGSRFTADLPGMELVLKELKKRNLFFLDSITAGNTVARKAARKIGVPFAARNIFLDHQDDVQGIQKRLKEVEKLARKTGLAVAIGHPRETTLQALLPWLEKIEARGFQLVPVSAVVKNP